ncbi:hypothetical protein CACET_c23470 [Clostridium aceticum]|uniref:Uncharacterized protein n=1 Tax=Clostridium aceticum TaxID=84022 RepID=A0A0D8I5T8_9CLOT|nr:hypothetical protein [Clostridium aceticum]AKL95793.1 hypothetical protein CACET_c23470 [Clostridium aceticum]KJF25665.1 hypothetical protein TZ02_17340 [Clostridium aceticum]
MESIIIFVIFAVITSIFGNNKKANKSSTPQKNDTTRQHNRGRLGELLQELKGDFDQVFKEQPSTPEEDIPYEYVDYDQQHIEDSVLETKYTLEESKPNKEYRNKPKQKNIYEDEIQESPLNHEISFDEETLLQGIIMSEILGKPKALRR